MNATAKHGENYIGYEYKEVTADRDKEGVYADGYPNFGWQLEDSSVPIFGMTSVSLKFKRDRKIMNKAELSRLQRQFEINLDEIEKLEQSKTTTANIVAFTVGLASTALMAGATFAFLAGMIPLCIILAVPAFAGWALSYYSFVKIRNKRIATIAPLLEQRFDSVYEICEKAHGLLV